MRRILVCCFALSAALGAQDLEPSALGIQGRLSIPEGSFRDALGGLKGPGLGLSLYGQMDLGEGWRARVALGSDLWTKGGGLPGEDREIRAFHASMEAVYVLRDEGPHPVLGPYVVAGVGAYAWSLGADITGTGETRRVTHAAGTVGFGWRIARNLELEARFLGGRIDPGLTAAIVMGAVNLRF